MPLDARQHVRQQDRGRARRAHSLLREGPHRHRHLHAIDPKSQDISELIGGIDLSTIGEVGVESDPRAYRFDGELNIANRGLMEFIEMLKVRREVPLRPADALAGAEHQDRPLLDDLRRRGDRLAHQRERVSRRSSATGRPRRCRTASFWSRCRTTCASPRRCKIYEKLLAAERAARTCISRRTRCASPASFAVLTRLEPSKKAGHEPDEEAEALRRRGRGRASSRRTSRELQEETVREGMDGISPALRHQPALQRAGARGRSPASTRSTRCARSAMASSSTPASATRAARALPEPDRARRARSTTRWPRRRCSGRSSTRSRRSARTLLNNYLDNVEAFCNQQKVRDPITDDEVEPDEKLMRSIEEQIGVTENAKKTFREEILIRISSLARRGPDVRLHEPRAAEGGDREEAVRRSEGRRQDHDVAPRRRTPSSSRRSTRWSAAWSTSTATAPSAPTSC